MRPPMPRCLAETAQRFWHDTRGVTAITTGLMMVAFIGVTAIAADAGSFYTTKRRLQGATDLAAMAAAADIAHAAAAAAATLAANGFSGALVAVQAGTYSNDPSLAASQRFVPAGPSPNAIWIKTQAMAPVMFGQIFGASQSATGVPIGARATAAQSAIASFAIGSRMAQLDGGIANAVLSALTGSSISLSAVDYQSLAAANIDMMAYARSLALSLHLQAGTYANVLSAQMSSSSALGVLAGLNGVNGATYAALTTLRNGYGSMSGSVSLGQLVDFGPYDLKPVANIPALSITMSAYDVASGLAQIATGNHQTIVDLGATIPGLADVQLAIVVGAPPVSATIDQMGAQPYPTIATTQVRAQIAISVAVAGLATLNLPIILDVARATAQAVSLSCQSGQASTGTLTLAVTPGLADLYIGSAASIPAPPAAMPTLQPAALATILGLSLTASGHASISNTQPTLVAFSYPDVAAGTIRTTSTINPVATLTASLLGNLQISGLGPIPNPAIEQAVTTALQGVSAPVDELLTGVEAALGIGIGQADTWVTAMRCGSAVLVN